MKQLTKQVLKQNYFGQPQGFRDWFVAIIDNENMSHRKSCIGCINRKPLHLLVLLTGIYMLDTKMRKVSSGYY